MKSIFISHVHENKKYLNRMKKWDNRKEFDDYKFTFETEDKRSEGKKAISEHIKNKIRGAFAVLVLIGKDTHNHDWIKLEVDYANSFHKKKYCVRIPETTGAMPSFLNKFKELAFDPNSILKELKS